MNYKVKTLLADRVLVLPDEAEKTTKGGLYLPDTAVERPRSGTVLKVGPGKLREMFAGGVGIPRHPMVVKEGDRVLYTIHSGGPVEVEGYDRQLRLMLESEIICVIE